jgi:hypothetical protein
MSPFSVQTGNYATNAGIRLNFVDSSLIAQSLIYADADVNGNGVDMAQSGGAPAPSAN